ncbi:Receptor-like cytosolic serine/threonine-protein [Vigna angularis]|uniref:non-specific serine/threonine protein kinase n=1 Tax=Phaseolus angularis TaxID=3914 RepID=A0A8T0KHT6_PHAAN|nr:Receptor-like cytosolic serine/threonine-protein [Vigna angularis]
MKYIRSNSLKRLFSFGKRGFGEENNVGLVAPSCEEHPLRPSWKCFSFEELFDATNGFSSGNLVGRGGYAEVYKGTLRGDENLPPLDWRTRYKIALGTARGLHYLHKGCKRRIIHRDIKASNVLLTADFEPKISDFGLARHLAPEYYMHGVVDEKTDVFAFGVFLLEILSGRKPVDGSHQSVHSWAKPILNKGEIEKVVDPRLGGAYDVTQFNRVAFAASLCIRASATCRPTMSEVVEVMEKWEIDKEKWEMAEEKEQKVELWGFDDLEYAHDTSFSMSPPDSVAST